MHRNNIRLVKVNIQSCGLGENIKDILKDLNRREVPFGEDQGVIRVLEDRTRKICSNWVCQVPCVVGLSDHSLQHISNDDKKVR